MRKYLLPLCLLLGTQTQIWAQAKLVEKITKNSASEIVIPYEKYTFPNGLTLIVHEDHSDPIAHVDVTYHVGSAREEIGKSGFAHFFEHMMFQGSDHVADEQHFKIITEAGGTLNGSTNRDRTNYFETVPSNQLEKMLWLESDRMGFLLDAVTQQKFEVQRATVKNERGQNYDNRPYGLVQETISKNLYSYGHPYSWLTIGYVEDLNRVNVNDLKNFFLRWYGPNNAVITIGGDVNTKEVVRLVDKYFGKIPTCPKVEKTILPSPVVPKDRYVTLVDGYAKIPTLVCTIPGVPSFDPDEAALDCLAEILGGSNSSILYQNLVKTQKATRVSCSSFTDELAGTFQINVMPKSGTNLGLIEREVRDAIAQFEKHGVTDDDITKFKNSREAQQIYSLESVSGKVSQLAAYQTYTGNANYIVKDIKRYADVTKSDVMRVYNKYVKGKAMVILSVVTKGTEDMIAAAPNYKVDSTGYKAPDYGYNKLTYVKANDFDRSVMPTQGQNPVIKVPSYNVLNIPEENLQAIHAQTDELPVAVVQLSFKGGRFVEQNDLSKAGLANLFTQMMDEDTKSHSAEDISTMLDKLGSSINISADLDEINVTLRSLKKNLNASMEILEEKLLQPEFKPETFDRIKNRTLEELKNSRMRAASVASNVYNRVLYGNKSILGYPGSGSMATVQAITLEDINAYYKQFMNRDQIRVVMVGDITKAEAMSLVSRITKFPKNGEGRVPKIRGTEPKAGGKTIYLADIPRAAQTEFRVGYETGLTYNALGEFYTCGLMNFPLGGAFNSRINLNLREDKGWTYGARSAFNGNDYTGTYTFSSGIKSPATDSALVEVMKEFEKYAASGITAAELSFMKNALGQSDARKYETDRQKADFLSNLLKHGLDATYVDEQNKVLASITEKDINELAKKWIDTKKMNIVLAGDKEVLAPKLEKLGYTIQLVDSEGEPKSDTKK